MADKLLLRSFQSRSKSINLSSKHLNRVPKLIGKLHTLFTVILKNNDISNLPKEFGNLSQVIFNYIDLFHVVRYCFLNNALSLYGSYTYTYTYRVMGIKRLMPVRTHI